MMECLSPFSEFAQPLLVRGYSPVPLKNNTKRPSVQAWSALCQESMSDHQLQECFGANTFGLGVACGFNGLLAIDIDTEDYQLVNLIDELLPPTDVLKRGKRGATRFYRMVDEIKSRKIKCPAHGMVLEVLSTGCQTVIPPTIHPDTKKPYQWIGDRALIDTQVENLPPIRSEQIEHLISRLQAQLGLKESSAHSHKTIRHEPSQKDNFNRYVSYAKKKLQNLCAEIAIMLPDSGRNTALYNAACTIGWAVHHCYLSNQMVQEKLLSAAVSCGLVSDDGRSQCLATIQSGFSKAENDEIPQLHCSSFGLGLVQGECGSGEAALAPQFSDEALALQFADQYKPNLRYVASWGRWLFWNKRYWRFDETYKAFDLSREVCRKEAARCDKEGVSKALASAKTVSAVIALARADRKLAATTEQWDCDPWALNTEGGIVDLETCLMRQHRPDDYITKITLSGVGGECPLWMKFLARVTEDDLELISYLKRICGYALTGSTQEQALFFLYGTGANGKSIFINTVSGIMGDYHAVAPIQAFTNTHSERHPTELAGLRGARLVTAVETEEGQKWAESRIKALTGGDKIAARYMRQDFFEFTPQFKLLIAGNHKPGLSSVDEAIKRRFNLIPFTVTIPPSERDDQLFEKLKSEWPGILQWMIDGCLEWQEKGLAPPQTVLIATAEYLDAEDAIARWLAECCEKDLNSWVANGALFSSWRGWAERESEFVGSPKRLTQKLKDAGFEYMRNSGARGFQGLKIVNC